MNKEFERLWWLFLLEVVFVIYIFLSGGRDFILSNPFNSILIILGLLTFVSVFYGFVFERFYTLQEDFSKIINNLNEEQWKKTEEFVSKREDDKILESVQETQRIKSFAGNINPRKWLFSATFSFILSLSIFFSNNMDIPYINIKLHFVATILFYLGIIFVFFLLNSLITLIISQNKPKAK
ncbi:MAG: hypothetical protein PHH54_06740 [Candidatus Nanoarchaeia archaeon]|nr:hypothetical protein [Candidatus Nanoarchaeia archaeon]MDD5741652.1 hypothetical protein [Candidatus Nanoarchaeia archaeon]